MSEHWSANETPASLKQTLGDLIAPKFTDDEVVQMAAASETREDFMRMAMEVVMKNITKNTPSKNSRKNAAAKVVKPLLPELAGIAPAQSPLVGILAKRLDHAGEVVAALTAGVHLPEIPKGVDVDVFRKIALFVFLLTHTRSATKAGSGACWDIRNSSFDRYLARIVVTIYQNLQVPAVRKFLTVAAKEMARISTICARVPPLDTTQEQLGVALGMLVYGTRDNCTETFLGLQCPLVTDEDPLVRTATNVQTEIALEYVVKTDQDATTDCEWYVLEDILRSTIPETRTTPRRSSRVPHP